MFLKKKKKLLMHLARFFFVNWCTSPNIFSRKIIQFSLNFFDIFMNFFWNHIFSEYLLFILQLKRRREVGSPKTWMRGQDSMIVGIQIDPSNMGEPYKEGREETSSCWSLSRDGIYWNPQLNVTTLCRFRTWNRKSRRIQPCGSVERETERCDEYSPTAPLAKWWCSILILIKVLLVL